MKLNKANLISVLALAFLVAPLAAWAGSDNAEAGLYPERLERSWLGPEGEPLPFSTDAQVLEFLRMAEPVSIKHIGSGVGGAKKVRLEKDGVAANACFRSIRQDFDKALMEDGSYRYNFRDDAIFEVAAYRLSRLLGLNNVPPAVERKINGERGSLQIWVEGSMTEGKRLREGLRPTTGLRMFRQIQNMRVFDNLIYNDDRNKGNILLDRDWDVWLIDHTRTFRRYRQLRDSTQVTGIERGFWERLQNLDPERVERQLLPYIQPQELRGLLKRREALVDHIQQLIDEKGENRVLFELGPGGST